MEQEDIYWQKALEIVDKLSWWINTEIQKIVGFSTICDEEDLRSVATLGAYYGVLHYCTGKHQISDDEIQKYLQNKEKNLLNVVTFYIKKFLHKEADQGEVVFTDENGKIVSNGKRRQSRYYRYQSKRIFIPLTELETKNDTLQS
jgi:hypothetical protein